VEALTFLGHLYSEKNDYNSALNQFNIAIDKDKHQGFVFFYRGLFNRKINKIRDAIADFLKVMMFDSSKAEDA
jgi:tetratricopeptide (TPR) repeat protein